MVLSHQKPSIFASIFHKMIMFFQTSSQRQFVEGQGANLCSKARFWTDLLFFWGPNVDLWSDIFAKKAPKGHDPELHRASRSRPGWDLAQKTPYRGEFWLTFARMFIMLNVFVYDFGMDFSGVFNIFDMDSERNKVLTVLSFKRGRTIFRFYFYQRPPTAIKH